MHHSHAERETVGSSSLGALDLDLGDCDPRESIIPVPLPAKTIGTTEVSESEWLGNQKSVNDLGGKRLAG